MNMQKVIVMSNNARVWKTGKGKTYTAKTEAGEFVSLAVFNNAPALARGTVVEVTGEETFNVADGHKFVTLWARKLRYVETRQLPELPEETACEGFPGAGTPPAGTPDTKTEDIPF